MGIGFMGMGVQGLSLGWGYEVGVIYYIRLWSWGYEVGAMEVVWQNVGIRAPRKLPQ